MVNLESTAKLLVYVYLLQTCFLSALACRTRPQMEKLFSGPAWCVQATNFLLSFLGFVFAIALWLCLQKVSSRIYKRWCKLDDNTSDAVSIELDNKQQTTV